MVLAPPFGIGHPDNKPPVISEISLLCWNQHGFAGRSGLIDRFGGSLAVWALAPEDHLIVQEKQRSVWSQYPPSSSLSGPSLGLGGSLGALCTATDWLEAPLAAFGCFHSPSLPLLSCFRFCSWFQGTHSHRLIRCSRHPFRYQLPHISPKNEPGERKRPFTNSRVPQSVIIESWPGKCVRVHTSFVRAPSPLSPYLGVV